uniref:F-box domain-containing protein n=1 Tax=Mycena chlorophos TaxID=658473 RepID=A0ABQ0LKV5_MYCCL|nr:predicted protein [Mycena chlorophos]
MDAETSGSRSINHLPVEILGEIFLWVLVKYSARTGSQGPWFLGHVCGLWRSISLALPQLWAEVWISSSWLIRIAELEEHLLRSADALLSVHIIGERIPQPAARNNALIKLMELVLRHCERWRVLVIMPDRDIDRLFELLEPAKNRFPVLEKLHFEYSWLDHVQSEVFLYAPKLVDLVYMAQSTAIQLPWNQIQSCYIVGAIDNPLVSLQFAQNLLNLNLSLESDRLGFIPAASIVLPRLQHLCCFCGSDLPSLTTPALESLFLSAGSELDLVSGFLARSRCPLKRLLIKEDVARDSDYYYGWPVTDMDIVIGMLRLTPALELLILVASSWPKKFKRADQDSRSLADDDAEDSEFPCPEPNVESLFDALQLTGSPTDIVPNLSTFIYGLPYDPIVWTSFMAMARSRSLASVRFLGSWDLSDVLVEQNVKEIQAEALRVLVPANFPAS